jgi:hypothetical protein
MSGKDKSEKTNVDLRVPETLREDVDDAFVKVVIPTLDKSQSEKDKDRADKDAA